MEKVTLAQKFELFNEHWSPKIIGELNDSYVKIAKFMGEFAWHKHDNEDELLYVVKGSMTVQFQDRNITINEGEFIIVPKGVQHCPKSEQESWIMLLEPKSTLNTGDVINEKTVKNLTHI